VDQSLEQQQHHLVLPQLRGQPAYARPTRPVVEVTPRPFDPDDLPLDAEMTEDEREFAEALPPRPYLASEKNGHAPVAASNGHTNGHSLIPRPFRLRSLVGRSHGSDE
jgi:hypothetical protein